MQLEGENEPEFKPQYTKEIRLSLSSSSDGDEEQDNYEMRYIDEEEKTPSN